MLTDDELKAITDRADAAFRKHETLIESMAAWNALEMHIQKDLPALLSDVRELKAEVERLKGALDDAIELAAEGISYTSEYFVHKWGMQERLDALKGGEHV